tara:strand:- start:166 stop:351 length:186 start_codon:yes stop_codon:yes gene_type:complete
MVTETHRKLIDNFYKIEAENKRLREALETMPECDIEFDSEADMNLWNAWALKVFDDQGNLK